MPYLEGPEISIDCLGLGNDLLASPTYKLADRTTKIDLDKEFCKCVASANDADAYIENILSFLKLDDDFVMKCGNAMHEYVASKYSWKLVADKYDSVIE